MDHVVYLDFKSEELEKLLARTKTMIVRGATGRKMPYGRVNAGDQLYFILNNADRLVRARALVRQVVQSDKLSEDESRAMLASYQGQLALTPAQEQRWGGKRYLVLIEVENIQPVDPFLIDTSAYGNMDDWLPVGEIDSVRAS